MYVHVIYIVDRQAALQVCAADHTANTTCAQIDGVNNIIIIIFCMRVKIEVTVRCIMINNNNIVSSALAIDLVREPSAARTVVSPPPRTITEI